MNYKEYSNTFVRVYIPISSRASASSKCCLISAGSVICNLRDDSIHSHQHCMCKQTNLTRDSRSGIDINNTIYTTVYTSMIAQSNESVLASIAKVLYQIWVLFWEAISM